MRSDTACGSAHLHLRGLQSERPMRPFLVVVPHELGQHRPQMLLVQHDEVVETFSAQGPDHSLRDSVGLWRVDWRGDSVDAEALGALSEIAAVDRIAIAEQMAWFLAPGRGLEELPPHSGCRRIGRHVDMRQLAPAGAMNTSTYSVLNFSVGTLSRSVAH